MLYRALPFDADRHVLVHVHIPKTGGSTLVAMLEAAFGAERVRTLPGRNLEGFESGLVSAHRKATGARNYTNCDSLLIGNKCGAHTIPYIEAKNSSVNFEHEATTSKISDDQLFYAKSRGLTDEEAVALIVSGFVKDVIQHLPMEFAVEAQKLIGVSLEGSVG
jgi:hypothetical protein